jgi:Protein of unknown function (DUF4231)
MQRGKVCMSEGDRMTTETVEARSPNGAPTKEESPLKSVALMMLDAPAKDDAATKDDASAKPATPGQGSPGPAHSQAQFDSALARCDGMLGWYEGRLSRARLWYRLFNTVTVILAAATPVLILWQPPGISISPIWQAAPAALASLFATLIGTYRWREDWIRYTVAAETLRSEKTKYTTRTTQDYGLQLSLGEALDNFVYRMESLAISEVSEWRNQLSQKTNEPTKDGKTQKPD